MAISQEQPPQDTPQELTEWLARQAVSINMELIKAKDFEALYTRPDKEYIGMVRFFGAAVDDTIDSEGLWLYKSDGWDKVLTHRDTPIFSAVVAIAQTGLTSGQWNIVEYYSEEADTHDLYDDTTATFQPTEEGYYQLNAVVSANSSSTITEMIVGFSKNGGACGCTLSQFKGGATGSVVVGGSSLVYMNGTTDYIQVTAYLAGGAGLEIEASDTCRFSGSLVRKI